MEHEKASTDKAANQGEGDYRAARRFNESERQFVEQHGTPRQPKPDPEEERRLQEAEERGRSRGKELDHDAQDESILRESMTRPDHKGDA